MITRKLQLLAEAIKVAEGWILPGVFNDLPEGSASYRNHNPGNLRLSPFMAGSRNGFAYFIDDQIGMFALIWDLWKKCKGQTSSGLTPESTLEELLTKYANLVIEPEKETYISIVETITQLKRWHLIKELLYL